MSWQDLHVKSCEADVTTPINHRGYCILKKKKRAAPISPSEGCNWLSGMGGWCHWCFPVRCSWNGVNLAPRWAISVWPHPMKDTLVPPTSPPAPHPPCHHLSPFSSPSVASRGFLSSFSQCLFRFISYTYICRPALHLISSSHIPPPHHPVPQ